MAGEPDDKPPAGSSGSVEISLSDPKLPEAAPEPVTAVDSQPVSSGRVEAAVPHPHEHDDRSGPVRLVTAAVSGGVEALGAGVEKIGEGVSKLGEVTRKVPLVGAGVAKLGEAVTKAGESIAVLPTVAKTRRGRLLVRSALLGFLLVFLWIAAIVMLQLRGTVTVDFRPDAERVLVELSKGKEAIGKVYDVASPRLHELVSRESFVDQFTDADATLGKFREIIAINDTLVTTGPTGKVGRVSFTASYDQGICKGSVSFHRDQGAWKLLGLGIEVPPDLLITQAQREQRVAACKNVNDWKNPKSETYCDVRATAESILEKIRDGHADEVFDAATPVFKQQTTRARFADTQREHRVALGAYVRIISVTEAKQYAGSGFEATFDVLAEFEKSSGVRVVFGFWRGERAKPWLLRSFKVVLPMPRAYDEHAGSAGSASASGSAGSAKVGSSGSAR
jgi:hypothetical protein